jgi:hypothetical protein
MGGADYWGFAFSSLTCPVVLVGGAFLFVEAHPRLSKNNPQAAERKRLGVHFGRAHWGEGTPEIPMASEYSTGVSGCFRQAGKHVVLSRTVLPVGSADQGASN